VSPINIKREKVRKELEADGWTVVCTRGNLIDFIAFKSVADTYPVPLAVDSKYIFGDNLNYGHNSKWIDDQIKAVRGEQLGVIRFIKCVIGKPPQRTDLKNLEGVDLTRWETPAHGGQGLASEYCGMYKLAVEVS
jgi:hypothetical protein